MARLSSTTIYGAIFWAALAAIAPIGAANAELKIGVVNVPRLLEEAPQAKSAMQALQDEFAPRQREIVAQTKDLKSKEEKLQRDGAVMAENERRNFEKDLRDGQREVQRKQNEYVEDLNLRRNEELGKLQRSLLQEVQTYAKSSNYDLVVGDGVLFRNDSIDITAQILVGAAGALQDQRRHGAEACGNACETGSAARQALSHASHAGLHERFRAPPAGIYHARRAGRAFRLHAAGRSSAPRFARRHYRRCRQQRSDVSGESALPTSSGHHASRRGRA